MEINTIKKRIFGCSVTHTQPEPRLLTCCYPSLLPCNAETLNLAGSGGTEVTPQQMLTRDHILLFKFLFSNSV